MKKAAGRLLTILLALLSVDVWAVGESADTLILPWELQAIGEEAFYGNISIEKVIVPDGVTEIGARAFANSSLTEIELPSTLEFIADDAFEGCSAFSAVVWNQSYAHLWCEKRGIKAIILTDMVEPTDVKLAPEFLYMRVGDVGLLSAEILPQTATKKALRWSSSDTDIVSVAADGSVIANDTGTAIITVESTNGLTAQCQISVISSYVSTTIPARTTSIAEISNNLKKINDIKDSAKSQIMGLAMNSEITSTESSVRQQIIDRAFEMQLFPWMTESTQPYWTSKYAYKQYTPGQVYYGLPYIQHNLKGSYDNREYNVAKAVSEGRYVNTNEGYYLLNREKLLGGMYVGCDCSSFMGISQYGINHPAAFIRTKYIVTSSYYETIDYSEMRPGDLLVMGGNHTVMFLYWVDAAQTKMMIIEQGGDGNTVICSIHDLSYYSSQGYIARRRVDFND